MSLGAGTSMGRRTQRASLGLLTVAAFGLAASSASAKTLTKIIPELYGGQIILSIPSDVHNNGTFTAANDPNIESLNRALQEAIGDPGAFGSSVSSFAYDAESGEFASGQSSLGPLLAESGATIGRGNFQVGISFERRSFEKFDGESLKSLTLVLDHVAAGGPPSEADDILLNLDTELRQDIVTPFFNLGVTDNVDVSLVLPLINSRIEVKSAAIILRNATVAGSGVHEFCIPNFLGPGSGCFGQSSLFRTFATNANPQVAPDFGSATKFGWGDVELRAKANLLGGADSSGPDLSIIGRARFPSGEEENFQGTGHYSFGGHVALSAVLFGILTPHLNAGIDFSTGGDADKAMARSYARYMAGADVRLHRMLTLSFDLIGRTGLGSSDSVSIKRRDLFDVGAGLRINPIGRFNILATAMVPINRNRGLRTDVTWSVGGEFVF